MWMAMYFSAVLLSGWTLSTMASTLSPLPPVPEAAIPVNGTLDIQGVIISIASDVTAATTLPKTTGSAPRGDSSTLLAGLPTATVALGSIANQQTLPGNVQLSHRRPQPPSGTVLEITGSSLGDPLGLGITGYQAEPFTDPTGEKGYRITIPGIPNVIVVTANQSFPAVNNAMGRGADTARAPTGVSSADTSLGNIPTAPNTATPGREAVLRPGQTPSGGQGQSMSLWDKTFSSGNDLTSLLSLTMMADNIDPYSPPEPSKISFPSVFGGLPSGAGMTGLMPPMLGNSNFNFLRPGLSMTQRPFSPEAKASSTFQMPLAGLSGSLLNRFFPLNTMSVSPQKPAASAGEAQPTEEPPQTTETPSAAANSKPASSARTNPILSQPFTATPYNYNAILEFSRLYPPSLMPGAVNPVNQVSSRQVNPWDWFFPKPMGFQPNAVPSSSIGLFSMAPSTFATQNNNFALPANPAVFSTTNFQYPVSGIQSVRRPNKPMFVFRNEQPINVQENTATKAIPSTNLHYMKALQSLGQSNIYIPDFRFSGNLIRSPDQGLVSPLSNGISNRGQGGAIGVNRNNGFLNPMGQSTPNQLGISVRQSQTSSQMGQLERLLVNSRDILKPLTASTTPSPQRGMGVFEMSLLSSVLEL